MQISGKALLNIAIDEKTANITEITAQITDFYSTMFLDSFKESISDNVIKNIIIDNYQKFIYEYLQIFFKSVNGNLDNIILQYFNKYTKDINEILDSIFLTFLGKLEDILIQYNIPVHFFPETAGKTKQDFESLPSEQQTEIIDILKAIQNLVVIQNQILGEITAQFSDFADLVTIAQEISLQYMQEIIQQLQNTPAIHPGQSSTVSQPNTQETTQSNPSEENKETHDITRDPWLVLKGIGLKALLEILGIKLPVGEEEEEGSVGFDIGNIFGGGLIGEIGTIAVGSRFWGSIKNIIFTLAKNPTVAIATLVGQYLQSITTDLFSSYKEVSELRTELKKELGANQEAVNYATDNYYYLKGAGYSSYEAQRATQIMVNAGLRESEYDETIKSAVLLNKLFGENFTTAIEESAEKIQHLGMTADKLVSVFSVMQQVASDSSISMNELKETMKTIEKTYSEQGYIGESLATMEQIGVALQKFLAGNMEIGGTKVNLPSNIVDRLIGATGDYQTLFRVSAMAGKSIDEVLNANPAERFKYIMDSILQIYDQHGYKPYITQRLINRLLGTNFSDSETKLIIEYFKAMREQYPDIYKELPKKVEEERYIDFYQNLGAMKKPGSWWERVKKGVGLGLRGFYDKSKALVLDIFGADESAEQHRLLAFQEYLASDAQINQFTESILQSAIKGGVGLNTVVGKYRGKNITLQDLLYLSDITTEDISDTQKLTSFLGVMRKLGIQTDNPVEFIKQIQTARERGTFFKDLQLTQPELAGILKVPQGDNSILTETKEVKLKISADLTALKNSEFLKWIKVQIEEEMEKEEHRAGHSKATRE